VNAVISMLKEAKETIYLLVYQVLKVFLVLFSNQVSSAPLHFFLSKTTPKISF